MPFASWSALTVDFLFLLHLSLGGVTLAALLHLVNAKWRFDVRYISVSFFALFPLAFVLLLVLLWHGSATFPWVGSFENTSSWNKLGFLEVREILGFLVVGTLYALFIKYQAVSLRSPEEAQTFRNIALLIPFAHVLFFTMVAWDFEMTLTPGWSSAIYAMYHFVSGFGMMLSVMVLSIMLLVRSGALVNPPGEYIYNFFAQLMLAFTILWTYTFFVQYLIIWYANLPDETGRIYQMQYGEFGKLFWLFFILKFVIPFPVLVFPYSRHTRWVIASVACSIIIGSWIERFTWIAGSAARSPAPVVSLFSIGITVVVFGLGYYLVRAAMRRDGVIR